MKKSINDSQIVWNESSKNIPLDKDPSAYAIEKEKLFPRSSIVCDLGGGTGADTIYFLQNGHSVILVDISDYALNIAGKKAESLGLNDNLALVQSDLSQGKLSIESDFCDVVYSRLSLHYFFPTELSNILREILRILKMSGVAYITIKSPKDKKEFSFLKKTAREVEDGVFDDNGQIKARYSAEKLEEILKVAGIDKFEVREYVENFIGRKDRVKSGLDNLLLFEIEIKKQ